MNQIIPTKGLGKLTKILNSVIIILENFTRSVFLKHPGKDLLQDLGYKLDLKGFFSLQKRTEMQNIYSKLPIIGTHPIIRTVLSFGRSYCFFCYFIPLPIIPTVLKNGKS